MKVYIVEYKNKNLTTLSQFLDEKRAKKFIEQIKKDKEKVYIGTRCEEV